MLHPTQKDMDLARLEKTKDMLAPKVKVSTVYETYDGKQFASVEAAYMHLAELCVINIMHDALYDQFGELPGLEDGIRNALQSMLRHEETRTEIRNLIDRLEGKVV